jgi:hypothetical protein
MGPAETGTRKSSFCDPSELAGNEAKNDEDVEIALVVGHEDLRLDVEDISRPTVSTRTPDSLWMLVAQIRAILWMEFSRAPKRAIEPP